MKLEQAARQALEALKTSRGQWVHSVNAELCFKSITILEEALAEQAQQKIDDGVMLTSMLHLHNCCVLVDDISEDSIEQVEQEPVAWGMRASNGAFFTITPEEHDNNGEGLHNIPLYAAPVRTKDYNPDVIFNDDGTFSLTLPDGDELRIIPPQQEPTAEVTEDGYAWGKDGILPAGSLLYAAPVRTKDLTDDEISRLWYDSSYGDSGIDFARAVIAADREKNK